MAQRTVVPRALAFPIPENVNDESAAALPNPGVSAWLTLAYRAKLVPGENVLILGATVVTGKLAGTTPLTAYSRHAERGFTKETVYRSAGPHICRHVLTGDIYRSGVYGSSPFTST